MELYNQKHIQDFYNKYGELETIRWEKSLVEKVKFLIHDHYLHKYISNGCKVLELGAGTGMFTKEIVKYSEHFVVSDLSSVQLDLNKKRAEEDGYFDQISEWQILDICDLSGFEDNRFGFIVCYGGPLSYVFEKNVVALNEMHRVLKPEGIAFLSVMNLWGTLNQHLDNIMSISKKDNEKIIATGNIHPSTFADSNHHCHMYRSSEFIGLVGNCGFETIEISASNCLSTNRANALEEIEKDKEKWEYFLDMEIRACKSSGMIESGTHLIAVVKAKKDKE